MKRIILLIGYVIIGLITMKFYYYKEKNNPYKKNIFKTTIDAVFAGMFWPFGLPLLILDEINKYTKNIFH